MEPKPISPVIVQFKALPGVRVVVEYQKEDCTECSLGKKVREFVCANHAQDGHKCYQRDYIWREVGEK